MRFDYSQWKGPRPEDLQFIKQLMEIYQNLLLQTDQLGYIFHFRGQPIEASLKSSAEISAFVVGIGQAQGFNALEYGPRSLIIALSEPTPQFFLQMI